MPELKLLIQFPMAIRWRDLDAFNHVNNSTFLTYLEETRLQWFAHLDGPWLTEDFAPVIAATNINYRAQLAWPGQISVELYCERLGNSSLTLTHRIVDTVNEKVYSDGNTVLVWIDPASGRPVALPEAIRRACQ